MGLDHYQVNIHRAADATGGDDGRGDLEQY